jgi:hypothetical protein
MLWYLKKSMILILMHVVVGIVIDEIISVDYFVIRVLESLLLGIPNAIFLVLLCLMNEKYRRFLSFPYNLFEIVLSILSLRMVWFLIDRIPIEFMYLKSGSDISKRSLFVYPFIEVYHYLLLFGFLFLMNKYFRTKDS